MFTLSSLLVCSHFKLLSKAAHGSDEIVVCGWASNVEAAVDRLEELIKSLGAYHKAVIFIRYNYPGA